MTMTALVLGATGGFGGAVAHALGKAGWDVRAMHRTPEAITRTGHTPPRTHWVQGDAMDAEDVRRAAEGVRVIVHGLNSPGYRNWQGTVVPMLDHSIAAAKAVDARLVVPGSIYNYGPDAGHRLAEDSPQNPVTCKGALRVRMERALEAAAQAGVRSLILRSGDYFGPQAQSSWLTSGMVKPGRPIRRVSYPGEFGVGHSWAYLPDLGETAAALIEVEGSLPDFDRFHFAGHFVERGEEFAEIAADLAGGVPVSKMPWWGVRMLSPFNETMRELVELRYLWREPHRLDGSKLKGLMGEEPRTPLRQALHHTLEAAGCFDTARHGRCAGARPSASA
jgi:nucleoside-diphosphate-sugar epimerase